MDCILGIESSCDETAAAVVRGDGVVLSSVVASQYDLHHAYGGVVPEIASRAHLERILPVIDRALGEACMTPSDISAVAVGIRPGLIGSLLVGVSAGKAFAWSRGVPLHAIDHVAAHLFAGLLGDVEVSDAADHHETRYETRDDMCHDMCHEERRESSKASRESDHDTSAPRSSHQPFHDPSLFPALGIVVSGGHTSLFELRNSIDCALIGRTIDDAAGEAFDKAAVMLGLPHPGGPNLERLARDGRANALRFPLPVLGNAYDFSFSGLKTKLLYEVRGVPQGRGREAKFARSIDDLDSQRRADLAASFQHAVVTQVLDRVTRAAHRGGIRTIFAGGGVCANAALRAALGDCAARLGLRLVLPAKSYAVDNAAMIAGYAALRRAEGDEGDDLAVPAEPVSFLARGHTPKRVH
jgi:N6-L-threonylcarbamoyladenine synthase